MLFFNVLFLLIIRSFHILHPDPSQPAPIPVTSAASLALLLSVAQPLLCSSIFPTSLSHVYWLKWHCKLQQAPQYSFDQLYSSGSRFPASEAPQIPDHCPDSSWIICCCPVRVVFRLCSASEVLAAQKLTRHCLQLVGSASNSSPIFPEGGAARL